MDRMTVALAGLLHDIGKFWQRADTRPRGPGYESFGPEDYGAHGAHATWSAAFVEQYVPRVFEAKYSVLYHHRPQDRLSRIVALADRLASGERADETEQQPRNLLSIFCQVSAGEQERSGDRDKYLPLRRLELKPEVLRPVPENQVRGDPAAYRALWDSFVGDVRALQSLDDSRAYLESLYYLLYRYTWCVPSAFYRSTPDISLFDHSRVTAAIAACLTALDDAQIEDLLGQHSQNDTTIPIAYLVEGDISGVQHFLYTLTSKGAAKGLRGRSFYLQLLNEAIARFILRQMDLPITNLIYVGGGHFYLLVPPEDVGQLEAIQGTLDRILLAHHDGALYLALGKAELHAADFQSNNFSEKWGEVGRDVGRAKRRRFADLPVGTLADTVFAPQGHGGNEESECQVCHAESDAIRPDDEGIRKCALCRSLEELGQRLGHSRHLFFGEIEPRSNPTDGDWRDVLAALGVTVGLLDERGQWTLKPDSAAIQRATVLGLRDFPSQATVQEVHRQVKYPVAAGLRYTANVTPRKGHDVATFEDMQEASQGLKRFGVLRMDVDDLGHLFKRGFQQNNGRNLSTLARVASLSSMLALFFEGWVGQLCQRLNEQKRRITVNENGEKVEVDAETVYTIYSGGDDLFIVGAWDVLPGLAADIRSHLAWFVADNPGIHVSAGITLHGGKYPLYQAAEEAGRALESAKESRGEKNAVAFLGYPVPWEKWEEVVEYQQELVDLVEKENVGRSLLQVLQQLYQSYCEARKKQNRSQNGRVQTVWGRYMWHSAYLLTRLADRASEKTGERVKGLRDRLSKDNFQAIEIIGLAARWAEALTRREKQSRAKEG